MTEENQNPELNAVDGATADAAAESVAAAPPLVLVTQAGPDEKAAARQAAIQKKRDESSEESPFSVSVGLVYDGPLDLLLDLIRKQDIDIYDIPIAKITAQFLAYVNQLKATDVDVAGEFIYTASLLIHIKSKMLLPRAGSGPDEVAEDPRRELVERLLEHERFKNAAQMLQQKQMLEAATWTNPGIKEFKDDLDAEPEIAADTVDLVRIFRDILERARNRPVLECGRGHGDGGADDPVSGAAVADGRQAGFAEPVAEPYTLAARADCDVSGAAGTGAAASDSASAGQGVQRHLHQEAHRV